MQSLSDDERRDVLGEVMMDELKVIREYLDDISTMKPQLNEIAEDVHELKADMKVVKAAVTDQSRQLQDHEQRISHLETAR